VSVKTIGKEAAQALLRAHISSTHHLTRATNAEAMILLKEELTCALTAMHMFFIRSVRSVMTKWHVFPLTRKNVRKSAFSSHRTLKTSAAGIAQ
jgi:hypothetical protein